MPKEFSFLICTYDDIVIFFSLYLDIVINNAGILRDKSFARISDLDWGKSLSSIAVGKDKQFLLSVKRHDVDVY